MPELEQVVAVVVPPLRVEGAMNRRVIPVRVVHAAMRLPYPLRWLFGRLCNNRWLYVGWVYDDWGKAIQIQVSVWRRSA